MEIPFFNRELSWLEFNQRVLNEAARKDLPLLERLKFLAISASNLDEFFMVRVGGLHELLKSGKRRRDPSGFTPNQQLRLIREKVQAMTRQQYALLEEEIDPSLRHHGIRRITSDHVLPSQMDYLAEFFDTHLFPVLTPLAVDHDDPAKAAQLIPNQRVGLLVLLEAVDVADNGFFRVNPATDGTIPSRRSVIIPIPSNVPRFLVVPATEGFVYMLLEDVVEHFCAQLFPGETVRGAGKFRISRNADISLDEIGIQDLAAEMVEALAERKRSDVVRLEVNAGRSVITELGRIFEVKNPGTYATTGPLELAGFMELAVAPGFEELKVAPWEPQPSSARNAGESIFKTLNRTELLLYHPYDDYEPVLALVEEAAEDPNVVAIKQILYRTAKNSRIITALIKAAERGKQVTVVVELKARFDEQRNLERADELERAGVQLIYGVQGLKTHAKACVVVRRERGMVRRYLHFGTGNYNESTARLYTDVSFLTSKPEYGIEASGFFNALTGGARLDPGEAVTAAPFFLRGKLMELIESETARASQGQEARIVAKFNSLQDREMIAAFYRASRAGVKIKLNVRGICCLVPGLPKLSKNIEVVSIVDRYLEHARIFYFHQGDNPQVFISSADLMDRNLDRRVELLVQVHDPVLAAELTRILERHFDDNCQAYDLQSDGTYIRRKAKSGKIRRAQKQFQLESEERKRVRGQHEEVGFVPHRPSRTLDAG
ncbi:MAG: polyphosphate kinase 1 [Verrucomicrobiae bacterium]|nr:polyphosphate kinase 1 [Verrucomicrobiae bacterium]